MNFLQWQEDTISFIPEQSSWTRMILIFWVTVQDPRMVY